MQKLKEKSNLVEKNCVRKQNKGISLVALIITIIVMVILAGIIIVSAVADGGVIDRAQQAMKENERAEAEELVIASYVYEKVASEKTYGDLDLDATAEAIYENLTANGFTLPDAIDKTDESGNVVTDENGKNIKTLEVVGNEIDLNIQGKHGNYTGTVTEKGLEDGIKIKESKDDENDNGKNDFEIEVSQTNNTTYENIYIYPTITADMFTEDEAVSIVADFLNKMTGRTDIDTFGEVILVFYTMSSEEGSETYSKYEELESYVGTQIGKEKPTEQEVLEYITGGEYTTAQQFVADSYLYMVYSLGTGTLKINGADVTESENTSWDSDQIRYKVYKNGIYKIELELEEKKGTKTIEVKDIIDFEITITDENKTNKAIITITPTITADMFTEEESVKATAKILGQEQITSLKELDIYIYNMQNSTELTEYSDVVSDMMVKMDVAEEPTEQEIFKELTGRTNDRRIYCSNVFTNYKSIKNKWRRNNRRS